MRTLVTSDMLSPVHSPHSTPGPTNTRAGSSTSTYTSISGHQSTVSRRNAIFLGILPSGYSSARLPPTDESVGQGSRAPSNAASRTPHTAPQPTSAAPINHLIHTAPRRQPLPLKTPLQSPAHHPPESPARYSDTPTTEAYNEVPRSIPVLKIQLQAGSRFTIFGDPTKDPRDGVRGGAGRW